MGISNMNPDETSLTNEFVEYAVQHHKNELVQILEARDDAAHYSITVNFVTLFETSMSLGDGILSQPTNFLPLCDKALVEAQRQIRDITNHRLSVKINVHARISALPVCPELYKSVFPRNEELGSFLRISGTVVRRTMPKMLEFKKTYLCNKCKFTFIVYADYDKHYALPPVDGCRNPEKCKSQNVVPVSCSDDYKDYQELKLQEQIGKLDMGSIPKSMLVTVEDDLVDACKPGDDVVICGTVRRRWKNFFNGSRPEVDLVVQANHLEVCNAQSNTSLVTQEVKEEFRKFWEMHANWPMTGRNIILQSVCPEVYGLYLIKLAIALVLAGGVPQHPGTGARVRGESHLLLVGDPGTAKSQLLRFAASVSPRSVFTTGIGSTSAGLTVSAAMAAGGEWQLEAGALVLADGGICCIDEFNSIRESERASIHEAMEQQTLSVAKAGMVCKLSTVCSILAATNPKGQFDTSHPITVNCAIASPLLSRFDLVFVLLDRKNRDWDSLISSYILLDKTLLKSTSTSIWNVEKLQAYFTIVKLLQPQLSDEASLVLREYYRVQRRSECYNASRITVRLLESLVRLAQAHAKLMFRSVVNVRDAVISVSLMEASHQTSSIDALMNNPIQTTFPAHPEEEYMILANNVLGNLGLQHLLDKEVANHEEIRSDLQHDHSKGVVPPPVDSSAQLAPEKSDLNKKLDIVLNNIRQAKLREENKAFAFQVAGAKRKKSSKKRGTKKKKTRSISESDSNDERNLEIEPKNRRPFEIDSSSDDDFLNEVLQKSFDNDAVNDENQSTKHSKGHVSDITETKPLTPATPTDKNAKRARNGTSLKIIDTSSSVIDCSSAKSNDNSSDDNTLSKRCKDVQTSDPTPKSTPICTKTINKLKAFAFTETDKDTAKTNNENLNESSFSSSTDTEKKPTASRSNSQLSSNSVISSDSKFKSTQSSIFFVGDDDEESDYEL